MMTSRLLSCAAFVALWSCTACVSTYESRSRETARQQADQEVLLDQMRRLQGRVESAELQIEELNRQVDRLRSDLRQSGSMQDSALTLKLSAAETRIAQLESARERDRQEIIDKLSERVTKLMAGSAPAATAQRTRPSGSATGYEHEVQSGQTLSQIAQAYGVTAKAIIDANNLQNPNSLRVGQKLFIPE